MLTLHSKLPLLFLATCALATPGCYVELGTDGETSVAEPPADSDPAPAPAPGCEIAECQSYCDFGGACAFEEGAANECVNDCLDRCDDGWSDEGDAAIIECVSTSFPDSWCESGLLESCCHELDGISDFCL
jgi:hypothetical protein